MIIQNFNFIRFLIYNWIIVCAAGLVHLLGMLLLNIHQMETIISDNELVQNIFIYISSGIFLSITMLILGAPVYFILFLIARFYTNLLIKKGVNKFEPYFLWMYFIFGLPFAIPAFFVLFFDQYNINNYPIIHMTPFYALILVPFNIGLFWLNLEFKGDLRGN